MFVQQLAELVPNYAMASVHEHSNCFLLAHKKVLSIVTSLQLIALLHPDFTHIFTQLIAADYFSSSLTGAGTPGSTTTAFTVSWGRDRPLGRWTTLHPRPPGLCMAAVKRGLTRWKRAFTARPGPPRISPGAESVHGGTSIQRALVLILFPVTLPLPC